MGNQLVTPVSIFTLNGVTIPCSGWNVHRASHGSLGTITAETSFAQLSLQGVSLSSLAESGAEIGLTAGFKETSTKKIFGGYFDKHTIKMKSDRVVITGRDWAADLVDKTQILAGLNYKNATIGQIVQQIANTANFSSYNITDPGQLQGSSYHDNTAYIAHPQPLWSIIKNLADQAGFDAHVNPDKSFYFGPIDTSVGNLQVTYGATQKQGGVNPVEDLEIVHAARRNGNFEVHVMSYDPYTNQPTSSHATSAAQTISGSSSDVNAHGSKGKNKSAGSVSGAKAGQPVILTFHIDGLTAAQCQNRAQGIAKDIAKREIIVSGQIFGLPSAEVHQTLQINSPNQALDGYESRSYVLADITHSYVNGAFKTQFIAMNEPTET